MKRTYQTFRRSPQAHSRFRARMATAVAARIERTSAKGRKRLAALITQAMVCGIAASPG